jgi:hypothetical protein
MTYSLILSTLYTFRIIEFKVTYQKFVQRHIKKRVNLKNEIKKWMIHRKYH